MPKGLFFQGAKLSKVALPCSKLLKKVKLLLESEGVRCYSSGVCVVEGGTPLFIHGARRCWWLFLVQGPAPTALAWSHATACRRGSWGAPVGGRPPLDHATSPPPSSSRMWPGHGSLLRGALPQLGWVELMGVSLVPLRESTKSAFQWIIPCTCVCDLQNNILQIHVELG